MTNKVSDNKGELMSKHIDKYSWIEGYIAAYAFFKDVLTDIHYKPKALSVENSEYWLEQIENDIKKFETELEDLQDE